MKKTLLLILVFAMLVTVFSACGSDEGKDTDTEAKTEAKTDAKDTVPAETDPATESDEDTIADTLAEEPLPVQGELPFKLEGALDLSSDILYTDFVINDGSGQWILGDDGTAMTTPLTAELLNEYKYFAISYKTDYCEEANEIALMLKYVHADGLKTEYLCHEWQAFGPVDMTFEASSFAKMPVYGEGVFYVPTETFLTNANYVEGDIINQIGLSSVEDTNTVVSLQITGAYLVK